MSTGIGDNMITIERKEDVNSAKGTGTMIGSSLTKAEVFAFLDGMSNECGKDMLEWANDSFIITGLPEHIECDLEIEW